MLSVIFAFGCTNAQHDSEAYPDRGGEPSPAPVESSLPRLTDQQYRSVLEDLFGPGLALKNHLEPVDDVHGLQAVGAAVSSISPLGAERYEQSAIDVAEQVVGEWSRLAPYGDCVPESVDDVACFSGLLEPLSAKAWRRPVSASELDKLVAIAADAAEVLDDPRQGLGFSIAAVLLAPSFLYRMETSSGSTLDAFSLASKLSFFLWSRGPDDELLAAAESNDLLDEKTLEEQVDRMMADPRFRNGLRAFFTDLYDFDKLDEMSKDPLVFKHMSADLPAAAREESLALLEEVVLEQDGDFRDVFTSTETWVDRRLAAIYDVPAPALEGFGWAQLPREGGRRGLLGHASVLALHAHAASSSVTLRGIFVREKVLCHSIPPPPADVNTSIPEASEDLPTMRERVARHLEDPSCATCHEITDLIGLGLEQFDGIARWRSRENGVEIDAAGELDGTVFDGPWELAAAVGRHSDVGPCLTEHLFAYAHHRSAGWEDRTTIDWHSTGLEQNRYRVLALVREIATSSAFRAAPSRADGATEADSGL